MFFSEATVDSIGVDFYIKGNIDMSNDDKSYIGLLANDKTKFEFDFMGVSMKPKTDVQGAYLQAGEAVWGKIKSL